MNFFLQLRFFLLLLLATFSIGCVSQIESSVTHSVAPGLTLERAPIPIKSPLEKLPGREGGEEVVGGFFSIRGFLDEKVAQDRTGIYFAEPYDPDKIPVLFVHGLLSDPYAWKKLTKRLAADPDIRDRFQFWFYAYPSSTPVVGSALIFKEHLDSVVRGLEEQYDQSFDRRLIVVGHSMGGLLTKSAVSETGRQLWNASYRAPLSRFTLSRESHYFLENAFFYEPRSYIGRAVFLAAPHRGSEVAEKFVGRLGASFADSPELIDDAISEVLSPSNRNLLQPEFREFLEDSISSVTTLRPSAPLRQMLAGLPIDPEVDFHSIAGMKAGKESDGIVPISSTQLEGALCEVVISSNHSVQNHPSTAASLSLILRYHAGLLSEAEATAEAKDIDVISIRH